MNKTTLFSSVAASILTAVLLGLGIGQECAGQLVSLIPALS